MTKKYEKLPSMQRVNDVCRSIGIRFVTIPCVTISDEECDGSVVECKTCDQRVSESRLIGGSMWQFSWVFYLSTGIQNKKI